MTISAVASLPNFECWGFSIKVGVSPWGFFVNILCEQGVIIGISNLNTLGIKFYIYLYVGGGNQRPS